MARRPSAETDKMPVHQLGGWSWGTWAWYPGAERQGNQRGRRVGGEVVKNAGVPGRQGEERKPRSEWEFGRARRARVLWRREGRQVARCGREAGKATKPTVLDVPNAGVARSEGRRTGEGCRNGR